MSAPGGYSWEHYNDLRAGRRTCGDPLCPDPYCWQDRPDEDECQSCGGAGYIETSRGPVECDCVHEDAHGYSRADLLFGGNW